jgi:hypothetical protein
VGKQSIPTTGLSPASPTALWAANQEQSLTPSPPRHRPHQGHRPHQDTVPTVPSNALPTLPVLARTSSDAGPRRPVRVKALRCANVFAFEPGPVSRKHGPTPERCPRQEPLGRNGPPTFTLCHRANGSFRAPFALPSQWFQGSEVEMTVQCHDRANCAGVYRCQNRTYDEEVPRFNGGIGG